MAVPKSGNMKQKENTKSASKKKTRVKKSPIIPTEPTDNYDERENVLRQFDMNMAYGPCVGISRLARWQRAQKLGKNPPKEVESLLKSGENGSEAVFNFSFRLLTNFSTVYMLVRTKLIF